MNNLGRLPLELGIIHFIGIGGIVMSGIAEVMSNLGYSVQGSDIVSSKITTRLQKVGINVFLGHHPKNLKNVEVVVVSSAIKEDNVELIAARQLGVPIVKRAEMLAEFYPDLHDEKLTSRFAIFHQRYSTNTFPSWDLAQPFRTLAHNGEINTLKGNINWMKIHEQDMSSSLFKNVKDLKPVIRSSSDSGALDNVFELLTHSGKLAPLIKLMMIPDAWSKRSKTVPKNHQDLFNFLNSTIEPWDGPAAICATDSKWVLASMDRNGLRPLRLSLIHI